MRFLSKKDIAKNALTQAILSGRHPPGSFLRQNDIAAELGLSSTPVREAFSDLQVTGLIVHEAHRGFRVAEIDAQRLRHIYAARRLLEPETARLAATRATGEAVEELRALFADMKRERTAGRINRMMRINDDFHRTLLLQGGNPLLVEAIERLWNSFPRFLPCTMEGRQEASLAETGAILKAFEAGDPDALAAAYSTHLDNALAAFLTWLGNSTATHKDTP